MEDFQNNYHGKIMLSQATDVERVAFYKKTYTHVAGGVLAFIVFEYFLLQSASIVEFASSMFQGYRMLILLGLFMLVTNYAESTVIKAANRNVQYMGYALYIFAEAFIFVPLIFIAVSITESFEVLNQPPNDAYRVIRTEKSRLFHPNKTVHMWHHHQWEWYQYQNLGYVNESMPTNHK